LGVEFRNSDLDFICGVGPRMENQKSEQYDKNLIHRTPPFVTPANLYILILDSISAGLIARSLLRISCS